VRYQCAKMTGKNHHLKRAQIPRDKLDDYLQDILATLKEKHPGMEVPKLRLWAKLIQSGHHADYVTPPNIPLITGKVIDKSKKSVTEGVADVVAQAATAIVKACNPSSSPKASDCGDIKGISPLKTCISTEKLP